MPIALLVKLGIYYGKSSLDMMRLYTVKTRNTTDYISNFNTDNDNENCVYNM